MLSCSSAEPGTVQQKCMQASSYMYACLTAPPWRQLPSARCPAVMLLPWQRRPLLRCGTGGGARLHAPWIAHQWATSRAPSSRARATAAAFGFARARVRRCASANCPARSDPVHGSGMARPRRSWRRGRSTIFDHLEPAGRGRRPARRVLRAAPGYEYDTVDAPLTDSRRAKPRDEASE